MCVRAATVTRNVTAIFIITMIILGNMKPSFYVCGFINPVFVTSVRIFE